MRKLLISVLVASLAGAPVQARAWRDQTTDIRPGAFVGVRLSFSTAAGKSVGERRAALMLAPTRSWISSDGIVRTQIAEGIALNLTRRAQPTLTLAGIRADSALGFRSQNQVNSDKKIGLSTGGKVAIGVGVALVVAAAVLYADAVHDDRLSD